MYVWINTDSMEGFDWRLSWRFEAYDFDFMRRLTAMTAMVASTQTPSANFTWHFALLVPFLSIQWGKEDSWIRIQQYQRIWGNEESQFASEGKCLTSWEGMNLWVSWLIFDLAHGWEIFSLWLYIMFYVTTCVVGHFASFQESTA